MFGTTKSNPSLFKYIGGPWALLGMGVLSLGGAAYALLRRQRLRGETPLAGDKAFTLSLLTGTWYELAHATEEEQPRVGISFQFLPVAADEIRVTRVAQKKLAGNGRLIADEAYFQIPDVTRPWEMILRQAHVPDENLNILYSDAALGVLVLAWDSGRNMLLLHDEPDMDDARYEDLLAELRRRGVPVRRFVRTPQQA